MSEARFEKRFLFLFLILLSGQFIFSLTGAISGNESLGTVTSIEGAPVVLRNGVETPLAIGDTLGAGEKLIIGVDQAVTVLFAGGNIRRFVGEVEVTVTPEQSREGGKNVASLPVRMVEQLYRNVGGEKATTVTATGRLTGYDGTPKKEVEQEAGEEGAGQFHKIEVSAPTSLGGAGLSPEESADRESAIEAPRPAPVYAPLKTGPEVFREKVKGEEDYSERKPSEYEGGRDKSSGEVEIRISPESRGIKNLRPPANSNIAVDRPSVSWEGTVLEKPRLKVFSQDEMLFAQIDGRTGSRLEWSDKSRPLQSGKRYRFELYDGEDLLASWYVKVLSKEERDMILEEKKALDSIETEAGDVTRHVLGAALALRHGLLDEALEEIFRARKKNNAAIERSGLFREILDKADYTVEP